MRASRETELVSAGYPIHVVTAWLGNTPAIAQKHYLLTTEADFDRAAGVDQAVQKAMQHTHVLHRTDSKSDFKNPGFSEDCEGMLVSASPESGGHGIRTHNRFPGI